MPTLAALVLSAGVASAQTAFSDSLVQSPTLQAPERGSVAGQYASVAFGPSALARGGFSLPAHLQLPSERGGPELDLNPQYSPEAGLSEWGLGWRAAPLSLQRWRPAGDLDYATDDLTGPWGHLVRGADGAWYAAGLQSLVRLEVVGASFVARLPDGSEWVFDKRVDTGLGTYAWYVTSITSAAGRRTELSYVANSSGRLFLSQVHYGGSLGRPMQYEVDFEYESIPQTFSDYRSGMALVLDRRVRVARMKVLVDGAMKERWSYSIGYQNDGFAYQGGVVGQAFLLTRIQRTFVSGAVEPAVTYVYSSAAERLATASFRSVPKLASVIAKYGPSAFQANRATFVDVDLDGRVDFESAVDGSIYRQTDDAFVVEPLAQPAPAGAIGRCRPAPSYSNPPRTLAELRIARSPGDEPHQVVTMINNAVDTALTICNRAGTVLSSQSIPYGWNLGPNLRLADLNRDSQPDLIRVFSGSYQTIANESSRAGFAVGSPRRGVLMPAVTPGATWLQDMNGDSVVDLVVRSGTALVVWRGKGNFQFEPAGSTSRLFWKSGSAVSSLASYELTFLDANKDGLTDLLLATSVSAALFVNTGASFQQVDVPGLAFVNSTTTRVVAADLAGSGDTELALVKGGVAYSLALVGADTGLLRTADDGKGNVLRFGYGRSPATAGSRHREAVLNSLTVETTGQEPISYGFDYQSPAVHSRGLFLVGFGGVRRIGAAHTWSETYLNSDAWSGLRVSGWRHDVNSPFADSFDQNEYEDASYQGVPWKRLKASVSGVRSPDATQVASERIDYLDYESEVCARTVERTGAAGRLRTVNSRAQVSGLGAALHCLPSRIDRTGFRPDGAREFSYSGLFERNAIGQITRLTSLAPAPAGALAPADALTLQSIAYTPDFSVSSMTLAGTGSARFFYDDATLLLNEIDSPDGVVTKVLDRDPLTDAVRTLEVARGGTPYRQYFQFDGFERLIKRWSNIGGSSEASPSEMLSYRLASGMVPATIFASELVDPVSGSARNSVDYYTGGGAPITSASAIPDGWTFGVVRERLPALRQTNAYLRMSLPASSSPLDLDYAALLASATATKVGQEVGTIHAHKASSTAVVQAGVERQLATTLKVVGGLLEETTTENGSLTTTRTLDAAGRLVAYRDEAGTTYRFSYDAMGRTREVVLPDGTRHTQVFDGHGRVAEVAREGVATIRFHYDPLTGLLTRRSFESPAGASLRQVEMTFDGIGRVVRETHTDLVSGESRAFSFYHDGAVPGAASIPGQVGQTTAVVGTGYRKTFIYRSDGRLVSRRVKIDGFDAVDVALEYFEDGSVSRRTLTVQASDGTVKSRSEMASRVDAYGRENGLFLNEALLATFAYDGNGLVSGASFATGERVEFAHDRVTRRFSGLSQTGATWASANSFDYNARGLVEHETLTLGSVSLQRNYRYSAPGFLVQATDAQGAFAYDYDAMGLSTLVQTSSEVRVIGPKRDGTVMVGGVPYRYDALGRVIQRGDLSLSYGPDGHLATARRGASEWRYLYDEDGQRIAKLSESQPVTAYAEGGVLDAGGFTEPLRIGRALLGLVSNGSFRLVPIDSRGTVMGDRDGTPRIASPYGEREVHPDTAGAIDYVEKGYDADLGLVRMGVRDYDPKIGRFLTPDPLYLETLDKCVQSPVQCNLYGYAAGNPLLYEDSTGLESKYRENFNTFADPLFWAGTVYGLVQGYAPGGAFLPPPGQDARFELGRSVGLGTAATAQVVTAAVAGFGAAATLGGGPTAVGAPALAAEAAQQLSMATVNVVAAVAAWQNAAAMAANGDRGQEATRAKPKAEKQASSETSAQSTQSNTSSASNEFHDLDDAASAALGESAQAGRRIGPIGPIKNQGVIDALLEKGYDPSDFMAVQYEATGSSGRTYIITLFEAEGGVYFGPHISSANF